MPWSCKFELPGRNLWVRGVSWASLAGWVHAACSTVPCPLTPGQGGESPLISPHKSVRMVVVGGPAVPFGEYT